MNKEAMDWLYMHFGVHFNADGEILNLNQTEQDRVMNEAYQFFWFAASNSAWLPEYTKITAGMGISVKEDYERMLAEG